MGQQRDSEVRLDIKPLSVNAAWQGRRFKTPEYKAYERAILLMLRPLTIPDGDLELILMFGCEMDFDNPVKPFVDCLQKKYGFNDRRITRSVIEVERVAKGSEYIQFEIRARA